MGKRKQVDWEQIERDYRADVKSVTQIAKEHGVARTTISSRATKFEWSRNLSARIKAKADEFVHQDAVNAIVESIKEKDELTVEENARLTAGVRIAHRKDITRARHATMQLLGDLEAMVGQEGRESLADLLKALVDEGMIEERDSTAIAAYKKATGLSQQVANMQKLADTMTKLVSLERQAWNLDNLDNTSEDPLKTLLDSIASNSNNGFGVVADDPEYDSPRASTLGIAEDDDDE